MAEVMILNKLIRLISAHVEVPRTWLEVGKKVSTFFVVNSGLKEGDALSPLHFNIALEVKL